MTQPYRSAEQLAAALVGHVGKRIVLGLPVGLGKAVHVANALFDRAVADPSLQLTIFTALTLEVPRADNDLERRLLAPVVRRLYAGWPELAFVTALRNGTLPPNVHVREFYFRPAAFLANATAQQNYTSINYSQVVDELVRLGVNVVAQLVSVRSASPGKFSLGSNPEVTLDLLPYFRSRQARGTPLALVGQVNRALPFMTGDAEVDAGTFDLVLDDARYEFPLFGLPNRAVGPADYAAGMHVASLIADGGTVQLGIGSLSDAVAHCLRLRHENPKLFSTVLQRLPGGSGSPRRRSLPLETAPFTKGLYACSELMSDALFSLFQAGIVRRPADAHDPTCIHAGFFIGSSAFYAALRELPDADRARIGMTRISYVNTLSGDESRKRRQRVKSRFVNETMMATLLGAAVSDALEDGRVVSGVGGQFDFVGMAHALADGMSILVFPARRRHEGKLHSNILWSYGHTTVPRHYRDVFVTEYGIAATRGESDRDVIASMLGIADAGFQAGLKQVAQAHQKIEAGFQLDADANRNTRHALRTIFSDAEIAPYFPRYPLGTDLTAVEQQLADALSWLAAETAGPWQRLRHVIRVMRRRPSARHDECLQRLELNAPSGIRERIQRRLVADALRYRER